MAKITIEIPEELDFIDRIPPIYWTVAVSKILKLRIKEIEEIMKIARESKATEKDVEELTDEIKDAVWDHYKK